MRFDPATRSLRQDPRDRAFFADPYPLYRTMREAGPVFWEDYGFWCFSRHADVAMLLRDKRFGRQNPLPPERLAHLAEFDGLERHSLLELEPPDHTRLRALVNRAFVSRQIERLKPRIAEYAEQLIDALQPGDDLIAGYAAPIPVALIAELVGAPVEDGPLLLDWSHKMVAMYQFAPTRADEVAANRAARSFSLYVRNLAAARRRAPRDDLISQLATTEGLSKEELVSIVVLLLNAGHEATVHALGNAVKAILEQGLGLQAAQANELAIDELLRFDAPLHMFTRCALFDAEFGGVKVKRGEQIGLLLGAANRDATVFNDPDQLDLSRNPNPHVSFGGGIHFCVGAPLARLELRVALPMLFQRLPGLALAEAPCYRDAYHFHGLESLRVRW